MMDTRWSGTPWAAALLILATAGLAPAVDPALLKLVTPDARVVGGINVTTAKTSPFGQYILNRMQNEDKNLQQFIDMTGFDPRRDLNEVVVASVGQKDQKTGIVAVSGNFVVSKILAMAGQQGQTVTKYAGVDVISSKHANDNGWVAFLNSSTALAGDSASVKSVLDNRASGGLQPDLAARAQALSARYQAWFLSTVPVSELSGNLPEVSNATPKARADFFQGVQEVSGGVLFGSQVEIGIDATTRSDRDAQALADVIRFMAGMVQQNQDKPQAAALSKLLDTLQLKTQGPVTSITLSIAEQDLEKLIMQGPAGKATARLSAPHHHRQ
jgi:hypothetical protein